MRPLTVTLLACLAVPATAQRPLEVLIPVDMDRVTGAVTADELGPSGTASLSP